MKDSEHIARAYPDLAPKNGETDYNQLRLITDLDAIFAQDPPMTLATSIETALRERSTQLAMRPTSNLQSRPNLSIANGKERLNHFAPGLRGRKQALSQNGWTRLGWAAMFAVFVFSFGVAAFAVSVLVNERNTPSVVVASVPLALTPSPTTVPLPSDPQKPSVGVEHLEADGLGKKVNLSHSMNGYTVKVEWVYADSNQALVRYDIIVQDADIGLRFGAALPIELTDDKGRIFPTIAGGVQVGNRDNMGSWYGQFDTSWLTDAPTSLNLRLTMSVQGRVRRPEQTQRGTPTATARPEPPGMRVGPVVGPFTFDFSVPFIPARVAHIGQTVTADRATVTLDEFRVTPSEARAIVHLAPPSEYAGLEWRPTFDLTVGNWSSKLGYDSNWTGRQLGVGRWAYAYTAPTIPYDSQQEWIVTVTELTGYDSALQPQIVLKGPWTFKVTVPPAGQK